MFKKLIIVTLFMCLLTSFGFCASEGTSGAAFLKIVAPPRAAAMGSAFTAFSDDVNSIGFNPSGLAFLEKKEIAVVQNNWIQDISNQYLAAAMPTKAGTFGLSVVTVSAKDMIRRDITGADNGTFDSSDMAVTLAYAKALNKTLGLGVNVKMITEKIDDQNASGYAVDLGGLYKASPKVDLGLAVQNIGTQIKFIDEGDPLPMTVKAGGLYKAMSNLNIALDVNYPNDSDLYVCLGAEYLIKGGEKLVFPVRAGYRSGVETGGLSGLGGGLGVIYDKTLGIDFAWTPVGDLGDSIKFGLSFKF